MEITSHDSFESMMEEIETARVAADARVKDWQKELKAGDYCVQWYVQYGFPIFHKILESHYTGDLENYRFCFSFSEACPEGERGDMHICVVQAKITKEVFDAAYQKLNNTKPPV
jgi:hypothetical protein